MPMIPQRQAVYDYLYNNAMDTINFIKTQNLPGVLEIGIFGSLCRGDFDAASDSDIYVLFEEGKLPPRCVKYDLDDYAKARNCDLVLLQSFDTIIGESIGRRRSVIWEKSPTCQSPKRIMIT